IAVEKFAAADVLLAGHGVLVARQRRPRLGECVDEEKFLDAARIGAGDEEALAVRRPGDIGPGLTIGRGNLRFGSCRAPGPKPLPTEPAAEAREAVILFAIGRELDCFRLFTFFSEIQVVLLGEYVPLAIGGVGFVIEAAAAPEAGALLALGGCV